MKKYYKYLIAFLAPIIIFFMAATLTGYYPTGKSLYNVYDSLQQYPGFYEQLKNFSLFSFGGGLGFNFYAAATYYLMSPFSLLSLFFTNVYFYVFYAIVIYLKIGLSGLFMYVFLSKQKKSNDFWSITLSIAYALSGFISCYYYNTMWMDAVYLLPLVLLGINKLVLENKKSLYLITLSLVIIFNYYIGYMVCIFSLIYFIYLVFTSKNLNVKQVVKDFIISSLLAALISSFVLIPSFFGLMMGKNTGFSDGITNYWLINSNIKYFFYTLTPGSFQFCDQAFGPAMIYSSLLVLVLVVLYFFNPKFNKKEKIVVGSIILFFFISFLWTGLDYAWQFFQRPAWWQSRYSFTFSAFLIIVAHKSISNIKYLKLNIKKKLLIYLALALLIIVSFICSYTDNDYYHLVSIIFFVFSLFIIVDYFLLIDKDNFKWFIIILLCLELFINSFVNLKRNNHTTDLKFEVLTKEARNESIELLNEYDDSFYRVEANGGNTSNDGMLYNYNGINYFNSVRNQRIINFMEHTFKIPSKSHTGLVFKNFNPYILSMLNVKYILTHDHVYFEKVVDNYSLSAFKNPYPLSIGFAVNDDVINANIISGDIENNINEIFSKMIGREISAFISVHDGEALDDDCYWVYDFVKTVLFVNGEGVNLSGLMTPFKKGDVLETDDVLKFFDHKVYEEVMTELSTRTMEVLKSNDLLKGRIEIEKDNQILFISIPYDNGFRIKVDDKIVEPILIFDTFIGIPLDKGSHEIIINYIPEGLPSGLLTSGVGILLSIVYLHTKKKNVL